MWAVRGGLLAFSLLWTLIVVDHSSRLAGAHGEASTYLRNVGRILEELTARTLGEVDKSLLYLRSTVEPRVVSGDYSNLVGNSDLDSDLIVQRGILDAKGIIRASSTHSILQPTIDLSDRAHFRFHVNNPSDVLFVGPALVGRLTNKLSIQVTRKFFDPSGRFAGVIVASLDAMKLARLYNSIDLWPNSKIMLLGLDGSVMTSSELVAAQGWGNLPRRVQADLLAVAQTAAEGTQIFRDATGTNEELIFHKRVGGHQLAISVAATLPQIDAPVWRDTRTHIVLGVLFSQLIALATFFGARYQRNLRLVSLRLSRSRALALRSSMRLKATLDSIHEGVISVDSRGFVRVINPTARRLLGLERDISGAGSLRWTDIVDHLALKGERDTIALPECSLIKCGEHEHLPEYERVSSNGTVLIVRTAALADGGFVWTLKDVTQLRRAKMDLEAVNWQLSGAISNVPVGIALYDDQRRLVMCNDVYRSMYSFPQDMNLIGRSASELTKIRLELGVFGDVDHQKFQADHSLNLNLMNNWQQTLADGRIIDVSQKQISHGRFVVTHTDVTVYQKLLKEIVHRQDLLKAENEKFNIAVGNIAQGICLFGSDRRIVFANRQFSELYGDEPGSAAPGALIDQIVQLRLDSGRIVSDRTATLLSAVKTEVHTKREASVQHQLRDGRVINVKLRKLDNGKIISTHEDITQLVATQKELADRNGELLGSEAALRERNLMLDLALSSMAQALVLFDADQRVVVANHQFSRMFNLGPDDVTPGAHIHDIGRKMVEGGQFSSDSEMRASFAELAKLGAIKVCLPDGRTLSVGYTKIEQGGFLQTFEDISKLQNALDLLEDKNLALELREAELSIKNSQFDAAISNLPHGLTMFDANQRIVLRNDTYLELYGYEPHEIRVGMTGKDVAEVARQKNIFAPELLDRWHNGVPPTDGVELNTEILLRTGQIIAKTSRAMKHGGWVSIHVDETEKRRQQALLAEMARHDSMTGLPNRFVLKQRLDVAGEASRDGARAALLLMDLDHFKIVNDTLGHEAGDRLLIAVAERLRNCAVGNVMVARLGGDEFAILQEGVADDADVASFAQQLIGAIDEPFEINGRVITVGASIGIALAPDSGENAEALLRNADLALYKAKEMGRGDFQFFELALERKMQRRRELEDELREALQLGQFELHYQPLVSIASRTINGVEALLRWRHPERGMISPAEFIPVAEETGLIVPIGEWVLREACTTAAQWPKQIRMSVNLSTVQFRKAGVVQAIVGALSAARLDSGRLEVEITESLLLDATESNLTMLHQLRDLGVGIALDDFGTGYSSLSYLQKFPFTRLKIDRSFVQQLGVAKSAPDIIRAIVSLASAVDMSITAEGIETEQQLALAVGSGCTEFQGYLFSRPVPASEIGALIAAPIKALNAA